MTASTRPIDETIKLQRIDLRTTAKVKNTLAHAAKLVGLSVSAFLIETAYEKAKNLMREQEIIRLSDRERDRFLTLLERPAKPNAKLNAAMQKFLSQKEK